MKLERSINKNLEILQDKIHKSKNIIIASLLKNSYIKLYSILAN